MFVVLGLVFLSISSGLSGCAASGPYGEALRTPSLAGYAVASHENTGGLEQLVLVPAGQSGSNWSEMVSTQTFKGGVEEGDPVTFSRWITTQWKNDCPSPTIGSIESGERNGYRYAFWRMGCQKKASSGKPEVALTMAIEGEVAFYTVQKSWRSTPPDAEIESWTRGFFSTVTVCDRRAEAGHPCPTSTLASK